MGTGAVAFNVATKRAILSDSNPRLINFYSGIASCEITPEVLKEYLVSTILRQSPYPVMPRRVLAVLSGIARRGAAGSRTLPEGQGSAFWQTPIKTTERRKQAASGGFLLDTFFWRSKRKYLAHRCENRFQNNRRVSDTLSVR
jgi:D12 class N6 adenine-specific DNA methyltransferase